MNQVQMEYMKAKIELERLETIKNQKEFEYIVRNGIKNEDGETPKYITDIEDDETYDSAIEEFSKIVEESGLLTSILEAKEAH